MAGTAHYSYETPNATTTSVVTDVTQLPTCKEAEEELCAGLLTFISGGESQPEYNITDPAESAWVWASLGFFLPLAVFGVIGNIVTIIMFGKYVKKTTTSIFIICLAVVDLAACGILMPIWFSELIIGDITVDLLCKLNTFLTFFIIPMSGCILLVIALDRFLIIFVIKTTVITRFRAKAIVAALFFLCLGISLPHLFTATTIHPVQENSSKAFCQGQLFCDYKICRETEYYIKKDIHWDLWITVMLFFLMLVVCFTVMYILIFIKVYRTHRRMADWRSGSNQSRPPLHIHADQNTFASSSHAAQEDLRVEMAAMLENGNRPHTSPSKQNSSDTTGESFAKQLGISRRRKKPAHLRTAITLSLVTCSFIVAYAPMMVMMFTKKTSETGKGPKNTGNNFLWHMLFLNHVMNPIIYSFMNPRFKDAVKGLVKRKSREKDPS